MIRGNGAFRLLRLVDNPALDKIPADNAYPGYGSAGSDRRRMNLVISERMN